MNQANPTSSPLISATRLAQRWGKHLSTIKRMVRDGIITPATRAGNQMGFALPDILRVEAGQLPKQRGLKSLSPDQRAAVSGLLELLGLEGEELTPAGIESLLNVYHSGSSGESVGSF